MTAPTFAQKLAPAVLPSSHIVRSAVSRLLDASADVPLTVVRGPWCSGKTLALAGWARARPDPVAWATLDRHDRDPVRLAATLGAALGPALGPEAGAPPATDDGDDDAGGGDDDRPGARALSRAEGAVAELLQQVAERGDAVTLVVDGVEALAASRAEDLFEEVVDYAPPNLHIVCSTVGPLPAAAVRRRRLNGQVVEVGPEDLRLDPEETVELLSAHRGGPVPVAEAAEVHVRAEGAVAVVASVGRSGVPLDEVRDDGIDDLLWTVLDRLRPDLALFVRQIAGLPRLTGPLCDAMTRRRGAAALLDELEQLSGVVVRDPGADEHRLHRALGPALVDLVERQDPELLVGIRRAAAHWWEREGRPREAIDQWLAAGDHAQAWALIHRHLVEVYFVGGRRSVDHWAEAPPPDGVRDPWHAVDRAGLLLLAGRVDEGARWIGDAGAWARVTGEDEVLRPALEALGRHRDYLYGDLEAALEAWPLHPSDHGDPRSGLVDAASRVDLLAHLGRYAEAEQALDDVSPAAVFTGPLAPVMIHSTQATLAWTRGRLVQAIDCADAALDLADGTVGRQGPGTESAYLALGIASLERGEVVDAARSLVVAHRASRGTGATHLVVRAALALARARGLQGRRAEALHLVEATRRPPHDHPLPPLLHRWIDRAELRLHLLAGDLPEVERVVARLPEAPDHAEDVVLRAWAALAGGDRAQAQDLLEPDPGPEANLATEIEIDLLRAQATGDVVRIRGHVAHAVRRGAADGYLTVFIDHRDDVLPALHDLRAVEPSPYLSDLLFVVDQEVSATLVERLTDREVAVVASLQSSHSIDAIAGELDVTVNTLKTHVKAIYRKLGVTSRADAVHRAIVLRIIGPEADDGAPPLPVAAPAPGAGGDRRGGGRATATRRG